MPHAEFASKMSRSTYENLQAKLRAQLEKEETLTGGIDGADATSAIHDDRSVASDLQLVRSTIANLKGLIMTAEIVEMLEKSDTIQIGSVVGVEFDDGFTDDFRIGTTLDVAHSEQQDGWLSTESALGKVLLGKKVGQTVSYRTNDTANALTITAKVVRIK